MIEEIVEAETEKSARAVRGLTGTSKVQPLAAIEGRQEERLPLPIEEFARVLGGGIVPGSVVLIGGDPGIGKSTLTLQMAMQIADSHTVLYVSGEESERQIKMRADRLAEKEQDGRPILHACCW
jgi:DNA repair protein RadA/Sms